MYIDAAYIDGRVHVSERNKDGIRKTRTYLPPYVFYYTDADGSFTSIYGDRLKRFHSTDKRSFRNALEQKRSAGSDIFESDVSVVFRLLEERYPTDDAPDLHVSFIDIEVDKDPNRGFSRTDNPYAEITAVTLYNKWEDAYYTLLVPPKNLSMEQAQDILDGRAYQDYDQVVYGTPPDDFGVLSEEHSYFLCETEAELLLLFLELIEDADIITGWNSEWYDLPYLIQRIRHVLGNEPLSKINAEDGTEQSPYSPSDESLDYLTKLTLFGEPPILRHVDHFGSVEKVYKLSGRVHIDYLDLYQKFTFEELHSYTLDFVLQKEIKQSKVVFEGTLDNLYRYNFRTFAAYNRQDVAGLAALDRKLKMVELANTMAHMAGVTIDKALGSVVIIEQAILKRLHKNGYIAFDKEEKRKDLPVPGAFVVEPDKGRYEWVCSYDFNSLYPTVIRLINISPEKIVGQFDIERTKRKWLAEFYDDPDWMHRSKEEVDNFVVPKEDLKGQKAGETWGLFTGVLEYHDLIDENDVDLTLVIEGTGDRFTMSAREWKRELREQNWSISANGTVFDLSEEGIVTQCMATWYNERVEFKGKKSKAEKAADAANDPDTKKKLLDDAAYYDMVQMVKKIFLNSTYGAYLNEFFRFYDPRLGASVTLSGRVMTKQMVYKLEELLDE